MMGPSLFLNKVEEAIRSIYINKKTNVHICGCIYSFST